jgi:hypothetical protein
MSVNVWATPPDGRTANRITAPEDWACFNSSNDVVVIPSNRIPPPLGRSPRERPAARLRLSSGSRRLPPALPVTVASSAVSLDLPVPSGQNREPARAILSILAGLLSIGHDLPVMWRWLRKKREQIRREVEAEVENVRPKDGAGCLLDGCCLGGCLLDLTVVAVLMGGVSAVGVAAVQSVAA